MTFMTHSPVSNRLPNRVQIPRLAPLGRAKNFTRILMVWVVLLLGLACNREPATNPPATNGKDDPVSSVPGGERKPPPGVLPSFVVIGAESGLDFQRFDDISRFRRILEVNGGGVGLLDFDRDGFLDVFFTNGCKLPIPHQDLTRRCEFFQNRTDFQFKRITESSGIRQSGYTFGCAVGDYDADGFEDLYITAFGRNSLWRNNGDGTFSDATEETGTEAIAWSSSAAFADLNRDGHLDLYVVNYLDESDRSPRLCANQASPDGYESCSPSLFDGVDDVLFLSNGRGGFVDATKEAGLSGLKGKGLGVAIGDFDQNGDPEIFVANDGEANFLFVRSDAEKTGSESAPEIPRFEERAILSGVALNESGYAQASMGVAVGDYDRDSRQDLFLTHFYNDSNTLYENRGDMVFADASRRSQLGATSRLSLGWGTVFLDADNNGWLDLFAANGHIEDRTWTELNEPYRMRPLMYRNEEDGTFANVSEWTGEYFRQAWLGRGAAAGDLDRDNRMDLAVSHQLAPSVVLRNTTETDSKAITICLAGQKSNRNGYGAKVALLGADPPLVRELAGGGSFQSASAAEIHLGLGDKATAGIRIEWPSGQIDSHQNLDPGQWLAVEGGGVRQLAN